MYDIDEIIKMLDWNNSIEVQEKGIELARDIKCINAFMFPVYKNSKSVWGNCAKILAEKTDEVLKPYLPILLGFLKDLNWPGSPIILERLQNFTRTEWLYTEFQESVKIAKAIDDHMWLIWLAELLDNEKLKEMLPDEMLEFLKDYYHSCWD